MRKTLKAAMAAATFAAVTAFAATPTLAQHMGGGGGHGGGGAAGSAHGSAGARPTSGGWHGGSNGWHGGGNGWHGRWGGWHGGWGCCGWRGWGWGWGWGWGPGVFWGGGWPWWWGGWATGVALATPYYDDSYNSGYDEAPPSGASPPGAADNYNCSAWRWDAAQNKYVQVRAACS
jgi:hypothetical protein